MIPDNARGGIAAPFLEHLDPEVRAMVLGLGRPRRHAVRAPLFFECDESSHVLIVRSGSVKLSITVDGKEVVLDVLGPGDLLGELSAIDGQARSATAVALTSVEVVVIPAEVFRGLLAECSAVADAVLRSVAARVRSASRRQVEYGALDALGRVCRRLVEMIERFGCDRSVGGGAAGVVIDGPLTQGDIAAWAGLSREAVVKSLHTMRRLGWVSTTAHGITVLDVAAVTARAGG